MHQHLKGMYPEHNILKCFTLGTGERKIYLETETDLEEIM
jgi:hypothetical protein